MISSLNNANHLSLTTNHLIRFDINQIFYTFVPGNSYRNQRTIMDTLLKEGRYILSGTLKQGNLEKYIDKYNMTCLAENIGIDVPKSKFVKWDTSISDVEYPCFIKPSHQKEGHYNEFKFKYCKDKHALKHALSLVRHDSVFIVQQFIKKEKDLLIYGCRTKQGEVIIAGNLITERFATGNGSSYGIIKKEIHQSIDVNKVRYFLDTIDYVGLFSFEYGLCDDIAYFFEVNLRNDGTSHMFFQAGANIPLAFVMSCYDMDYSNVLNSSNQ